VRLSELRTGGLCLSELAAYAEHLSADSAVRSLEAGLPPGWSRSHVFLTDIFAATNGDLHPARAALANKSRAEDVRARLVAQAKRHALPDTS